MFEKLLSYLKFGNTYWGIEQTDNTIYGLSLKRSKSELDIDATFECSKVDEIAEYINKRQHAILTINTSSVLTKEVNSSSKSFNELLNSAFPNIKIQDFYFNLVKTETTSFISVCRKDIVDDVLEEYSKSGIQVLNFVIGPLTINHIATFAPDKLVFSGYKVEFENNSIASLIVDDLKEDNSYGINGLSVNNRFLLSLAGALQSGLSLSPIENDHSEEIKQRLDNYLNDRFFYFFLRYGIGLLLVVLLINFLFFSYYFDGVNDLQQQAQTNLSNKAALVQLNETVERKKQLTDNLLTAASSSSSKKIDDIIQLLPESILLEELNYHPIARAMKKDQEIDIVLNQIQISGKSNNKTSFTNWILKLEQLNWVKSVLTSTYNETGKNADFLITMETNDDQ